MKTTGEFLSHLYSLNIKIWVEGPDLCFDAPKGSLTAGLRTELRQRKPEIIAYFTRAKSAVDRATPVLGRVPRTGDLPLSFAQQRLWFIDRLEPNTHAYNMPVPIRLDGRLDLGLVERCLTALAQRHETLRTRFAESGGKPVQIIDPVGRTPVGRTPVGRTPEGRTPEGRTPEGRIPLKIVDLCALPELDREALARRLLTAEALRPFSLERGSLIRATLYPVDAKRHILLLNMHHIISDKWSLFVLMREFKTLYAAFTRGQPSPLPPLAVQYADFACWQRGWLRDEALEEQLAFWENQLADAPRVIDLPLDRVRPARQTYNGRDTDFLITGPLAERTESLCRERGVTPFMALLAVFGATMIRYSGQDDLLIGSPIANRNHPGLEDLIGFFVNSLVLRVDGRGDPDFAGLLARVKRTTLTAYAHQDLPFEQIVERLQPERDMSRPPLFQVVFSLESESVEGARVEETSAEPRIALQDWDNPVAKFDLSIYVLHERRGFYCVCNYNTDLFHAATVDRITGHFQRLLKECLARPQTPLSQLPMLDGDERHRLLETWNATRTAYPRSKPVHALFEAQAERTPDAIALTAASQSVSYGTLWRRARQIAAELISRGAAGGATVGLCSGPEPDRIAAMLGILASGNAYVPLEQGYPAERLGFMLRDTGMGHLVTTETLVDDLPAFDLNFMNMLVLDELPLARFEDGEPLPQVPATTPAYIMYTSGSTGRPKGVAVPHRAVVRLVTNTDYADFNRDDIFLQAATVSFDASTFEIWGALLHGARLVSVASDAVDALPETLARHRITTLWLTAQVFHMLLDDHPAAFAPLRQLLAGGEALSPTHVRAFRDTYPGKRLINGYGPTEGTTFSICCDLAAVSERWASVPIGKPIANTTAYILDRRMAPQPQGIRGELWIGGDGLAQGYWRRPERTAESFLPNPFADPGQRLYRTGDLARYLDGGLIEFLGRIDRQVKLRGFRIELGEIEHHLKGIAGVREALVRMVAGDAGTARLAAYAVGSSLDGSELRRILKTKLPAHMVPAAIVVLDGFPLTANGKLDLAALPEIDWRGSAKTEARRGPRTPTESVVATVWEQVLGVDDIGMDDDFFELGGHSLLATQLVSRVRELLRVDLTLRSLFEAPTAARFAAAVDTARLDGGDTGSAAIEPVPRDRPLPLSFGQQRLWFLQRYEPENPFYNIPVALRLKGVLAVDHLERGYREIVARHEVLRTTFAEGDGEAVQVIHDREAAPMLLVDLTGLDRTRRHALADGWAAREAKRPFDLESGPMLRVTCFRLESAVHALLVLMHHIVSDGWSFGLFTREISALYRAFAEGGASPLAPLPVQYADYAHWQRQWLRQEVLDRQLSFWRGRLENAPGSLSLPLDYARPERQSFRGGLRPMTIETERFGKLRAACRGQHATPFMGMLAVFKMLLNRYAGQADICVGTPIENRNRMETEPLIGFFVNMLVLRTRLNPRLGFSNLLAEVREGALAAYTHQDLPFEHLVDALQPERHFNRNPLVQVMFTLENNPTQAALALPELETDAWHLRHDMAQFDLTMSLTDRGDSVAGHVEYSKDLFAEETVDRMIGHFGVLLDAALAEPDRPVEDLPLMTDAERDRVLVDWNHTGADLSRAICLHQRFEIQAERNPDAVALVCDRERGATACLTYRTLNRAANGLALRLRQWGVGPCSFAALDLTRENAMVVGLLAILKVGGAYLPLNPDDPRERLAGMLADARPCLLLTREPRRAKWPATATRIVTTGRISPSDRNGGNPELPIADGHAAYAIYTSGSTGKPKAVVVPHRGIVNRVLWMERDFPLTFSGKVLQKTQLSFDAAGWELYAPLFAGGQTVLARPGGQGDPAYLVRALARHAVTRLQVVPTLLRVLLAEPGFVTLQRLREVFSGGEALDRALAERFRAVASAQLVNLYGPTEASIDAACWPCDERDPRRAVPIGRPIANTGLYILDSRLAPTAIGVPGLLAIAGRGLARGYHQRPDLTAAAFIPNPFPARDEHLGPGSRLYLTGDRARFRSDGAIEHLGRTDHQVKLRGFRIELGEIESALNAHPAVKGSVALVRTGEHGQDRLLTFVLRRQLYTLPNRLRVDHFNRNETDTIYREVFEDRTYLQHGVALKDGDTVFDVGANIGLFTLFVHHGLRRAKVYSFEPIPPIFDKLRTNLALHGLEARAYPFGLADSDRAASFTFYPKWSAMSGAYAGAEEEALTRTALANRGDLLAEHADALLEDRFEKRTYPGSLRSLSSIMRELGIGQIDLLKIDAEKSEADILAGIAQGDWPKIRQIAMEVHDLDGRLDRITSVLEARGFRVTAEEDQAFRGTGLFNLYAVRSRADLQPAAAFDLERANLNGHAHTNADLVGYLKGKLPEFMVPAAVVEMDAFPTLPSGKLDRAALPEPDKAGRGRAFVAPGTPTESLLAGIWSELLELPGIDIPGIGIHDNFFELGGNSISAILLVSRLRKALGIDFPLKEIFPIPDLAAMARFVERLQAETTALRDRTESQASAAQPILPERVSGPRPLSFAQQRLWMIYKMDPAGSLFNMPSALRLQGPLDSRAMERAIGEIVGRHAVLRTTFAMTEEHEPVQVAHAHEGWTLPTVDLAGLAEEPRDRELHRLIQGFTHLAFDLERGPVFRATILRFDGGERTALFNMHHIVSDGWSTGIMVGEWAALYTAFCRDEPSPLAPLSIQYADFAAWQRRWLAGGAMARMLSYWRHQLGDAPRAQRLGARTRPLHADGRRSGTEYLELDAAAVRSLKTIGRENDATLFMVLLAGFKALLHLSTGENDIVIGTDVAGRNREEIEGLIGFFVNQLVLRTKLTGTPGFKELLEKVRETTVAAYAHGDLPFDKLVETLSPKRDPNTNPLFQTLFLFQNAPSPDLSLPGLHLAPVAMAELAVKTDLELAMWEAGGRLYGSLTYARAYYEQATVARWARQLPELLHQVAQTPDLTLEDLGRNLRQQDRDHRDRRAQSLRDRRRGQFRNILAKTGTDPENRAENSGP